MSASKSKIIAQTCTKVGPFQFDKEDLIGEGQFGTVYKGQRTDNPDQEVAIKVIKK